jgi:GT2 family glycosyltransferase
VIIPTYGDWEGLRQTLAALGAQSAPPGSFEVVVGNNNATPGLPADLVMPPWARIVWQPKPGSYAARNAAVSVARGDVLFFTDAGCIPDPDWIATGLRLLTADPALARIGGAIVVTSAGSCWTVPEIYDRLFGLQQSRYVRSGYAATANLVVRRAVFDAVGTFDEALFSSGDKEWNGRAGMAGHPIVFVPDLRVHHPARASFADHAKKRARVVGGKFAMKGRRRRFSYRVPVKFLLPSLSAALRIAREPGLTLGQRLSVYRLHYRLRLVEFRTRLGLGWNLGRGPERA